MDLFNEFATDETLEIEGRWVPFNDKTSFKIARANNKHFARLFTRLYQKQKVLLASKGETAEQASEALIIEVMAQTILLGWKGPLSIKGQDLSAYSVENAKKALAFKDFRIWITSQSEDFEAFKAVQEAEDAKN